MSLNNSKKIYLVVPKLIEQPTWGGDYIVTAKKWGAKKEFKSKMIGQSYELFSESKLRSDLDSSDDPNFTGEIGYAMEPDVVKYSGRKNVLLPIGSLIKKDPIKFLGKTALKKHGPKIKILIKFTQSNGNSFQIHVKENANTNKWQAKPESWYFLEPGRITLGVKKHVDWKKYKSALIKINKYVESLSRKIIRGAISLQAAKNESKKFVAEMKPYQYVNEIWTKKGELIDLSQGGVHHSWEDNDKIVPSGNIVYELCLNVMDPVSVLRSCDKGKIKPDGSLRKLNIEDYFKYIDRSAKNNDPKNLKISKKILTNSGPVRVEALLRTKYYSMDRLVIAKKYAGEYSKTDESYNHLFILSGKVKISTVDQKMIVGEGHSCFLPAGIKKYELEPIGKTPVEILKTFVQ